VATSDRSNHPKVAASIKAIASANVMVTALWINSFRTVAAWQP
jgi:hypothetical protein